MFTQEEWYFCDHPECDFGCKNASPSSQPLKDQSQMKIETVAAATPVPPVSKKGQYWFIQIRGERALREVIVGEETEKTVQFYQRGKHIPLGRYLKEDVTFVEKS